VTSATSTAFDASAPWRLSPQVSLREEPFGALAYHHVTRRLVFVKSNELVALLRALENFDSAASAIRDLIAPAEHDRYERALGSLATSGVIDGR
jgi:putative mycofactocin binding protein MftB